MDISNMVSINRIKKKLIRIKKKNIILPFNPVFSYY